MLGYQQQLFPTKNMTVDEIHWRYYRDIKEKDFVKIVKADIISSSIKKNKLGKYAKWLLNLFKANNLKIEDLSKAKKYIRAFDYAALSKKIQNKDLNTYKSLPQMYLAIKDFMQEESISRKEAKIKSGEVEKLYEDESFVVIHPKTQAASCLYGKGTQWCTAARSNNMFHHYNEDGKLHIIINKKTNSKFQFHAESDSYMDENDSPISYNDNFTTNTIEKINATKGLSNYLLSQFPNLNSEYTAYLKNNKLYDSDCKVMVENSDCRITELTTIKAWYVLYAKHMNLEHTFHYSIIENIGQKWQLPRYGKIYMFEDLCNNIKYILFEKNAGFFQMTCYIDRIDVPISMTEKMNYSLLKCGLHPLLTEYCDLEYKKQRYFIVKTEKFYTLYCDNAQVIIDENFEAENIIPFKNSKRDNELIIVKEKYTGIYNLDTNVIRWGYKGAVEDWLDDSYWTKRTCIEY
ncbi:MAG: hypothetical protein LBN95_01135 [Prevotellaceae bacterium]|jgi:hypothetical protein|nr:hypothetical protein [Prevotellaceae bacterium]